MTAEQQPSTTRPSVSSPAATAKIDPHVAAGQGNLADVKAWLKAGGLIDKRDEDRWTPLMMAVREGHLEVAKYLLRTGASLEARDADKWTAMHVAAANGHPHCCQLLLDRGANPRVFDENKRTPLHWATRYGYAAVVELLLKRGADVDFKDADGKTPAEVVGKELGEDSSQIVHDLLTLHARDMKVNKAKRRGSCPNITPAVRISGLDLNSLASPVKPITAAAASANHLLTSPPQASALPQLSIAPGASVTTEANGVKPRGGDNRQIEEGSGCSSVSAPKPRPHRRGSYSAAPHIRDHPKPVASASPAPASLPTPTPTAATTLPTSPIRGQTPRQSASTSVVDVTSANGVHAPSELGDKGEDVADIVHNRVDKGPRVTSCQSVESEAIVALRQALAASEGRLKIAEAQRLKEESARRDVEVRARILEARVSEMEKLMSNQAR